MGLLHLARLPDASVRQQRPLERDFSWEVVNYAPILVGGAILLFGGWWVLSAKNWFKGPIRMGTEEELERIEEQYELASRGAPGPAAGA